MTRRPDRYDAIRVTAMTLWRQGAYEPVACPDRDHGAHQHDSAERHVLKPLTGSRCGSSSQTILDGPSHEHAAHQHASTKPQLMPLTGSRWLSRSRTRLDGSSHELAAHQRDSMERHMIS